ncbi:MAG: DegV family protein [Anaerolineales bacterium]|nr:DegV family protein [Anaerolineales bacterium]
MSNVKILTDSLADIPAALIEELEIAVVPCTVRFGTEEFIDRVNLFPTEFYHKLVASPTLPTTAFPSSKMFEEAYRKLAEETDRILAIHTIASLTGIYNASRVAAENIQNARIELVDSEQVSMSLGWLVILAARAAKEGATLAQVRTLVENAKTRVHIIAMLDTLEYAQRGGRLGKGAALVGSLLNVKPLVSAVHSEIVPVENVRTQKRALERLAEIVLASGPIQELAVIHADALHHAQTLQKLLAKTFPLNQIVMSETGPVLGTHTGPGAVGIAWLTGRY